MAASQESGIGRLAGRFATIVLAAATVIGAGPTTLGLVLADSPPVVLAAASTPTTGWAWKAEGLEGGGSDSGSGDSGGDEGGDTNVSGSSDGGDSDGGDSGSGDAPEPAVSGSGSDKSDSDSNSESGPTVDDGAKKDEPGDGESGSAVGTEREEAEPGDGDSSGRAAQNRMQMSERGEDDAATTVDGQPKTPEAGDGSSTTIDGRPAVAATDDDGQSPPEAYADLIRDSSSNPNTQVSGGRPTPQNPDGTPTAVDPATGILNAQREANSLQPEALADGRQTLPFDPRRNFDPSTWQRTPQSGDSVLDRKPILGSGPITAYDPPPPGTRDLRPLKQNERGKNPNDWDMVPTAKDFAFGGIGGTAAASERGYKDAYKVDPLSDDELTKRGQKVSDKFAEAQSDRVFYNKMMERNSNPSFREYYRARAFEAGENATKYQRQLDAMGAPKRGLTNISDPKWFEQKLNNGGVNTAMTGSQASEALTEFGPTGDKLAPKVSDAALAAGAKTVNAAEGLSPKLSAVGGLLAEDAKTLGKAAPIIGYGATAYQAWDDIQSGKSVGRVAQETGGSVAGGIAGGAFGGMVGTALLPGIGTAAGVALGNAVGSWLGGKAGDWLADQTMGEGK
jgi:hypothetical protein